jgi:hypothetical protein
MDEDMFSRDEVLGGGLSRTRRARACLYLIEQEASRQADRRRRLVAAATAAPEGAPMAVELLVNDDETMRRELPGEADEAYVESFRNARRAAKGAGLRTLARTIEYWRVLVPSDAQLRAEVLRQMAVRHTMTSSRARKVAAVFGVGDPDFDATFETIAGHPVQSLFPTVTGPRRCIGWLTGGRS